MLLDLRQVRRYMTEPGIRQAVQGRVAAAMAADTRVLVGHSLGSVVAYEALCAHPEWPVRRLVTLRSPLGIRNLIFDRLVPPPVAGMSWKLAGAWPGAAEYWTNIADAGDVVALAKDLRPLFGDKVACYMVHDGSHEAKTDRDKGELFAACRAGSVAVLIGSTEKMGVGNVQARAVALHHLDCPWRPADVAQREGRILRQGILMIKCRYYAM